MIIFYQCILRLANRWCSVLYSAKSTQKYKNKFLSKALGSFYANLIKRSVNYLPAGSIEMHEILDSWTNVLVSMKWKYKICIYNFSWLLRCPDKYATGNVMGNCAKIALVLHSNVELVSKWGSHRPAKPSKTGSVTRWNWEYSPV